MVVVVRCVTFSDVKFIYQRKAKPEFNGLGLNCFNIKGQTCNYFKKQSVENYYTVNFSELIVFYF